MSDKSGVSRPDVNVEELLNLQFKALNTLNARKVSTEELNAVKEALYILNAANVALEARVLALENP